MYYTTPSPKTLAHLLFCSLGPSQPIIVTVLVILSLSSMLVFIVLILLFFLVVLIIKQVCVVQGKVILKYFPLKFQELCVIPVNVFFPIATLPPFDEQIFYGWFVAINSVKTMFVITRRS